MRCVALRGPMSNWISRLLRRHPKPKQRSIEGDLFEDGEYF